MQLIPKKIWRNIKNVLPDQKSETINIVNPLTQKILPKDLQAQEINNFFANIGENIARKFQDDEGRDEVGDPPMDQARKLEIENITIK